MSQFIIIAYDGKDEAALQRRMDARDAHLSLVQELKASGNALAGIAIADDAGTMIGSVMVMDFPSRADCDAWLAREPYVAQRVWQDITVLNGKLPPTFAHLLPKA